MYAERQRLRPWLEDKINSGKVPGLCWRDREKKEFRVSWKHAGKPDFNYEKDAMLFKLWAEHTGKYHDGESPDPSTWKTRFRCALHKMPDVVEVRVPHSLDEKDPYRVFRFTAKEGGMSKRNPVMKSKTEKNISERYHPYSGPKSHKTLVIRPPPESDDFSFKLYGCDDRYQDSPHPDSSDGSFSESCDLDAITPTIPTYHYSEIMMPDEGPVGSQPLLNSDNQRNCNGDFMNSGLPKQLSWLEYNAGKEFVQALLETNGLTANGSVFGENTQAIQQHFMTTNPGGLMNMKLWWGEFVIPDESTAVPPSSCTHLNMDNGSLEIAGNEFEDPGRLMSFPRMESRPTLPLDSKAGKLSSDSSDFSFKIRVFYGSHEVLSTETRLTESERWIRFSYGSPQVLNATNMDGAKQINLPEVDSSYCQDILKVMSFLAPGILLEVTEDFDLMATRLALLRVFYSNGWETATKLEREKSTKVFDYKGKYLQALKLNRNGYCKYPLHDLTFYLGRADGSLVSIVVTHVKAKMSLHNEGEAVQQCLLQPNLSEKISTSLKQDCLY
ncbi:uncharacterized protein [Acropora muricata]|uniref:uncharacterized protein n=1 Tax=Acropora muricata TaxID=159855 RepID=UPI0034E59FD5